MMRDTFHMVAKTFQGLEEVLAEELRGLGALNVEPGKRMVAFDGDLEILYKANICCRTALRILKPFYTFTAQTPDELYEKAKSYDWMRLLSLDKTFSVDTTSHSEEFTHSKYATYRVKDAIVDKFRDRFGEDKRPGVRVKDADLVINVHISGKDVTLSLDSSGESLSKRGYVVERTEAPINEVLAAGIILLSGWRGDSPFIDPMCGSGTFLIEAALIAARINPGLLRRSFAFEKWKDFDADLFYKVYNDDSNERIPPCPIIGADISPKAIAIANANLKNSGMAKYVTTRVKSLESWEEAPSPAGVIVTNPPYGERISSPDMGGLYSLIGSKLKHVFQGYHAWIIGYREEYFHQIGLAPSQKIDLNNGGLDCQLREYIIFEGDKKTFKASGGKLVSSKPRFGSEGERPRSNALREKYEKARPKRSGEDKNRREGRFSRDSRFAKEEGRAARDPRNGRNDKHTFQSRPKSGDSKFGPTPSRDINPTFAPSPDNPLSKKRNPRALEALADRQPRLKPMEGPIMRSRGWRKTPDWHKPDSDGTSSPEKEQ